MGVGTCHGWCTASIGGSLASVDQRLRALSQVASILLPMAFLYDVWWVFLQPLVTGGDSVMIVVAQGGGAEQLPMLLEVPHKALGDVQAYSMLGYGTSSCRGCLRCLLRALMPLGTSHGAAATLCRWWRGTGLGCC